jgi:hypothetical protein
MRCAFALIVFVACGSNDTPETPAECEADYLRTIDKSCVVPADCVLVDHDDCCGTIKVAVHSGGEAAAHDAEMAYQACVACPPTGCFHADEAEDQMSPGSGQSIVAVCTANRCSSIVN